MNYKTLFSTSFFQSTDIFLLKQIKIFLVLLFLPALPAFAQGIVPECSTETIGGIVVKGVCRVCDIWRLGDNIVTFFIFDLAIPILTVAILVGGAIWATSAGSTQRIAQGRKIMTTAVLGVIFALGAWLAIDTIIKTFASPTSGLIGAWNKFPDCVEPEALPLVPLSPIATGTSVQNPSDSPTGTMSHESAQKLLNQSGIQVLSTGNCYDRNDPSCTSLDGMRPNTIAEVLTDKNKCPSCDIIVTGGTEIGHAAGDTSHSAGYKIDLKPTASLTNFIQNSGEFTQTASRTGDHGGIQYCRNGTNACYVMESDPPHWDVTVQ